MAKAHFLLDLEQISQLLFCHNLQPVKEKTDGSYFHRSQLIIW